MSEPALYETPDGGELRRLPGGLVILRRAKHEWRDDLASLEPYKLKARTGKKWGSKFYPSWTLERILEMIAAEVARAGWTRGLPPSGSMDVRTERAAGLVEGEEVHTIRIVSDGHYVHGYPVKD